MENFRVSKNKTKKKQQNTCFQDATSTRALDKRKSSKINNLITDKQKIFLTPSF